MKKSFSRFFLAGAIAALFIVEGCDKEDTAISTKESNDVSEEALMDAYFQDMDDMSAVVVASPAEATFNGGRTSGTITVSDPRFQCNTVTVTLTILDGSTTTNPKGQIVVDFGSGCTDLAGNSRSGKLIFTYSGKRYQVGSSVITTTDNYVVNGVKLEGTRTTTVLKVNSSTDIEYHVVLVNGKATFDDQTTATRASDLYLRFVKGSTPAEDKLIVGIDSEATGTTRRGTAYTVTLSKALEYHRYCALAVSGIKNFSVDGRATATVDYGAGDCDGTVTITVGNASRTVTIGS